MLSIDVKRRLKEMHEKQWKLAQNAGVSEWTLTRWLRNPALSQDQERIIRPALEGMEQNQNERVAKGAE